MGNNKKTNLLIFDFILSVFLIVFIAIRLFNDVDNIWFQGIECLSLCIATIDLYVVARSHLFRCKYYKTFVGITILLTFIFLIMTMLVVFKVFYLSEKGQDIITLTTLLLSVPRQFHIKLLKKILK